VVENLSLNCTAPYLFAQRPKNPGWTIPELSQ